MAVCRKKYNDLYKKASQYSVSNIAMLLSCNKLLFGLKCVYIL